MLPKVSPLLSRSHSLISGFWACPLSVSISGSLLYPVPLCRAGGALRSASLPGGSKKIVHGSDLPASPGDGADADRRGVESVHKSLPADGQPCARPGDKACITILRVIHALPPSRTQGCPQPPEMRLIHPSHTPDGSGRNLTRSARAHPT